MPWPNNMPMILNFLYAFAVANTMLKLLVIVLLLILIGGTIRHVITDVRFDGVKASVSPLYCRFVGYHDTKPVIFLPGIKGSILKDGDTTVWLTLSQLFHNTEPFFYDESRPLQPAGILTRITILPGLIAYAPYQRLVATLACNPNAYFFSYDWRRPLHDNAADLLTLVERVNTETGQKPSIVAHSMGGLLTHLLMKDHSSSVDKVVYVGVPFNPGIGFMTDIDKGAPVGLNKTILSKDAVFSHPSSLALLPHAGNFYFRGKDLMEERTWLDEQLSTFKDGDVDIDHFRALVAQTIATHAKLDHPAPFNNDVLFVNGDCADVIYSTDALGKQTVLKGDGRVAEAASFPVEKMDLNYRIVHSCARHDIQLNDKKIVTEIIKFLR